MDPFGDAAQPIRPMVDREHGRHHRQQDLGGTDITRGLFPSDVLLACLKGESDSRLAGDIFGDADESTRHLPFELFFGR